MRAFTAVFLTLAMLASQAALGQASQSRDIVFECPCSAVFTPDAEGGGGGTLDFDFGVRSFRESRTMGVGLAFSRLQDDYQLGLTSLESDDGPAFASTADMSSGLSPLSVFRADKVGHGFLLDSPPPPDGVLLVDLVESASDREAGRQGITGEVLYQDSMALWPVPGARGDRTVHYVDIQTDSDEDGVGDVNEWIAAGWRPGGAAPFGPDDGDPARDDGRKPGDSVIDVLWLYEESLHSDDLLTGYRHAATVAGHLFADSGVDFRLRPAKFLAVPSDKLDFSGGGYVDMEWFAKAADEHGADVPHVLYSGEGVVESDLPCGGAAGCGDGGVDHSSFFLPFGAPSSSSWAFSRVLPDSDSILPPPDAVTIAHELGHVFGLAHSAAQGEAYGAFRHSRGHYVRRTGGWARPDFKHGTIMSYGNTSLTPVFSSTDENGHGSCEPIGKCGLPADHPEGADAVSSLNLLRFQFAAVRGPNGNQPDNGEGVGLDPRFRSASVQAAFVEALGKPAKDISPADMKDVKGLSVDLYGAGGGRAIDLSGIERTTKLNWLALRGGGGGFILNDISALKDLKRLTDIAIENIEVGEGALRALRDIPQLQHLKMRGSGIDDDSLRVLVAALSGAGSLLGLNLSGNSISDVAPFCNLPNPLRLTSLVLARNTIRDILQIQCLTGLGKLDVSFNDIGVESLLDAVNPMGHLTHLDIGGNPRIDLGGVFDPGRLPDGFLSASRFDDGAGGDKKRFLGLSSLGATDLSALAAFMAGVGGVRWTVLLDGNGFIDLGPLANERVWPNGGVLNLWGVGLDANAFEMDEMDGHIARLEKWGVIVEGQKDWYGGPLGADRTGEFKDAALAAAVRGQTVLLGGLADYPLYDARLGSLDSLHASGRGISDLSGIVGASNLRFAHLASNRISDLSPLLDLDDLLVASLDGNPLSEDALNKQVPGLIDQGVDVILNAVSWTPDVGGDGTARFRAGGYFAAKLGVADAGQVSFVAETDREVLAPSVGDDGLLRIKPARLAGTATVRVMANAGGEDVALDFHIVSPKTLPLFLEGKGKGERQGFLRVVNHSGRGGDMRISARDDFGNGFGPVTLSLNGHQAIHLNSGDLEKGNPNKGLRKGLGDGEGDWRLTLEGALNAEALAYVRTADGFVTAMHDVAPRVGEDGVQELMFFNPGSNHRQESRLRLINDGDEAESVRVTGIDDAGSERVVMVDLPAGEALRFTAAKLESGAAPGLSGKLGDGKGKWRLRIEAGPNVTAMGLLETPTGHLANLSAPPAVHDNDGIVRIPLFLSASEASSETSRVGFMRVVNRSSHAGTVDITAYDDAGAEHGPVSLSLSPRGARHFNSVDLESGNAVKGLEGSIGPSMGNWRLKLASDELDFEALAYVRTGDGFVTAMHEVAPGEGTARRIAFLNPGSNYNQRSLLRLINGGEGDAEVTITGIDDEGKASEKEVVVHVPGGAALSFTAAELEGGADARLSGALGDGKGKWRLCVSARGGSVTAMGLLNTPTGHQTNLSGSPDMAECPPAVPDG